MTKRPQPTNAEVLDVIIPVLVQLKKEGKRLTEAAPLAIAAVRKRQPDVSIKSALAKVTRLRIL
jgi:hypothetical protein